LHSNTVATSNTSSVPIVQVTTLPNFTVVLDSGPTTMHEIAQEKPIILDFWASWCPNCQRDMPILNSYYKKYGSDVEVLGINLREDKNTVDAFVRNTGIDFPIIYDRGQIAQAYGVAYTNYHILINKDASQHSMVQGDISESHVQALIAANQ